MAMGVELNISERYLDASDTEENETKGNIGTLQRNSSSPLLIDPPDQPATTEQIIVTETEEEEENNNVNEEDDNVPRMSTFTSIIPSGLRTVVVSLNSALQPHLNSLSLFSKASRNGPPKISSTIVDSNIGTDTKIDNLPLSSSKGIVKRKFYTLLFMFIQNKPSAGKIEP